MIYFVPGNNEAGDFKTGGGEELTVGIANELTNEYNNYNN